MNRVLGAISAGLASAIAAGLAGFGAGLLVGRLRAPAPPPAPANPVRDAELDKHGHEKLYDAILATAGGAIDRARTGAQWIETAAAAIVGIYTGLLGFVFVTGDNPLPVRGLAPAVFLAASVALAAFYIAFLTRGRDLAMANVDIVPDSGRRLLAQAASYVEWISASVINRQAFLRGAVVSLAIGVLLLPLPFVSIPDKWAELMPGEFVVQQQTNEEAAADEDALLVLPDPQFTDEIPVELAEIAYQARVDAFVASLDKPPAPDDAAENYVAIWAAIFGAMIVAIVMVVSVTLDLIAWTRRRLFGG
jgi:hypothetical protein